MDDALGVHVFHDEQQLSDVEGDLTLCQRVLPEQTLEQLAPSHTEQLRNQSTSHYIAVLLLYNIKSS